jgi:hypothetical protein
MLILCSLRDARNAEQRACESARSPGSVGSKTRGLAETSGCVAGGGSDESSSPSSSSGTESKVIFDTSGRGWVSCLGDGGGSVARKDSPASEKTGAVILSALRNPFDVV